jgi:hypothetical protein
MFGLFKSKSPSVKVIDKVWMSQKAKWNACVQMMLINPGCLFVAWFEDTRSQLEHLSSTQNAKVEVVLARTMDPAKAQNRMVVFTEHYPLSNVEQELFLKLNLKEVPVLSSLEEPLFMKFSGNNIIEMMKNLGMKEDEVIGHAMVTKAIRRAQEALEKSGRDQQAASQQEWFSVNTK